MAVPIRHPTGNFESIRFNKGHRVTVEEQEAVVCSHEKSGAMYPFWYDDVQQAVRTLRRPSKDFYAAGIRALTKRWDR